VQEAAGVRGDPGVQFGECKGRFPRGIPPFPFYGAEYAAVKDWDGIGGEMVVVRKWQAAAGKPRGTETKAVNPGKAKLIVAMDRKFGENSEEIAQKLISTVLAGDWTGAKLLCALADGQIDCENVAVVSTLYSYAQTLKSEQQLTDAEAEAAAKTELDEGELAGLAS
jgi:hypothetical protein